MSDSTAEGEDGGPFGHPLFEDPSARALSRVGVVDVGSNSVRLVVFDGAARSPAYFYNEKILCGLGQGLAATGHLNPEGKVRALAALHRFVALARSMGIPALTAVATAAMREAEDGPAFRATVLRETGLRLWVIDGPEEARLSAQGVLLGWPEAEGIVCDIGGSSMELAVVQQGRIGKRVTAPLGPFRLQQIEGGAKGRRKHIEKILQELRAELQTEHRKLYLVGGSWRAIAKIDMERRDYPLKVLHEYRMTQKHALATIDMIAGLDAEGTNALRARTGTSSARMDLVPLAAEVLKQLIRVFHPKEIDISSYGIREGLLYEQMPQRLRARDPLVEACRFAEATGARQPGFGKKLFSFLMPLYRSATPARIRLIKAACLLHDTTWRAHPDYRAEVCFDNATRANLGGLDHRERVFLGLALLHRYKNSRSGTRFEPLYKLLDEREVQEAEVLGKAMRFGAMIAMDDPTRVAELRYFPRKHVLELRLMEDGEDLYGEVAQARFASLVAALKVTPKVTLARGHAHPARGR